MLKKGIILDRDRTLIEDTGYAHQIEELKILPGVIEGLKLLEEGGYLFFIVANQLEIGKGYCTVEDIQNFNNFLLENLSASGIKIQKTSFCPNIENCACKKLSTMYAEKIKEEFGLDLASSWVIGAHPSDVQMGINAGCRSIYLLRGHGKKHLAELEQKKICPDKIANDFLSASLYIIENQKR